jgi:hypothetical protein
MTEASRSITSTLPSGAGIRPDARLLLPLSMTDDGTLSAFRLVPRTGVIYVNTEAAKRGFRSAARAWSHTHVYGRR